MSLIFSLIAAHVISAGSEVVFGAGLVCAEAHTLPRAERQAVAAVVREHVRQGRAPAMRAMRWPRAWH